MTIFVRISIGSIRDKLCVGERLQSSLCSYLIVLPTIWGMNNYKEIEQDIILLK